MLGLHEGSVVAMAAGHRARRAARPRSRCCTRRPGSATPSPRSPPRRLNRAPLVIVVGQQDRRHLALDPFLAGKLDGLAGEYPVHVDQPPRRRTCPGAIVRAYHEAVTARGPALVIVPMDDWSAPAPEPHEIIGPRRLLRSKAADPDAVEALAALPRRRRAPGARLGAAPTAPTGRRSIALAERLSCPVFHEPFGARRASRRTTRCSPATCPPVARGCATTLKALRRRPDRRHRRAPPVPVRPGPAGRARDARSRSSRRTRRRRIAARSSSPCSAIRRALCAALAEAVDARAAHDATPRRRRTAAAEPAEPLRAGHVLAALAERLPRDAILRRGDAEQPPRAARADPGPRPARLRQRDGHARLRAAGGDRAADGDADARSWRWSATARASTRSRRCGARPPTASACCSSSCATAATRS